MDVGFHLPSRESCCAGRNSPVARDNIPAKLNMGHRKLKDGDLGTVEEEEMVGNGEKVLGNRGATVVVGN